MIMIKVCHMTSVHKNTDVRIFEKQCVSLANAGYEVYLVAQGDTFDRKGVHVRGVKLAMQGRIYRMITISKEIYIKALEIDADIYHFHDPELLPYGLKLYKLGKKVIYDSHEDYPCQIKLKKWLPRIFREVISTIFKEYETYICKQIDCVISICPMLGKNIFEGRAKRTVYINNAPIISEFERKNNTKRRAVCHIGSLTYDRGITHLIKAVAKTSGKLILAGMFSPKSYEHELRSMKEWECVDYRGFVDRQGVADILAESVAGISTLLHVGQHSIIDTFQTKVYEYMAAAIPVILYDYPYAKKMVKELRFGLCVAPDNPDEIAKTIQYIFDHPDEACEMGKRGRIAVERELNWNIQEKVLLELYNSLSGELII